MRVEIFALLLLPSLISGEFVINADFDIPEKDWQRAREGHHWAVLVAGSNGYYNYRHQADVCHAYQILRRNGIPAENIVTMMYDDIAFNELNDLKGEIVNKVNGSDVYKGVIKDYTKEDVNPKNFLNVLTGNAEAMKGIGTGKVVMSGPQDRIFVNLVDHGGLGIFCFPYSYLYARELVQSIVLMHQHEQFKEMVLYVESCESGSLFDNLLPDDINVYAVSASTQSRSSYACCFDPRVHVYVGDLFSVSWMQNTESGDVNEESLETQYETVLAEVRSVETPMQFGDVRIRQEYLSAFLGPEDGRENRTASYTSSKTQNLESSVKSRDIPMHVLQAKFRDSETAEDAKIHQKELLQLFKNRQLIGMKIEEIVFRLTLDVDRTEELMNETDIPPITDWDCYEDVVRSLHLLCFNLGQNSYALRFMGVFWRLCRLGYSSNEINNSISIACDGLFL